MFDVERSRRHLRDSVHYNGGPPSRWLRKREYEARTVPRGADKQKSPEAQRTIESTGGGETSLPRQCVSYSRHPAVALVYRGNRKLLVRGSYDSRLGPSR